MTLKISKRKTAAQCHPIYAVGKKIQEHKVKLASSTQSMTSANTPAEPLDEVDPVQEPDTLAASSSTRALNLQ